jgi:hypothetical protein
MNELQYLLDEREPDATFHDAVGWYLFFSDWNAFACCGAASARFEWA